MFFALPASEGFLLAGGAALIAQHLTERPTQDLDFFASQQCGDVAAARDELEAAVRAAGWSSHRLRDSPDFCRLMVSADEELLVDIALDSPPHQPPTISVAGPTFNLEELAGRKVVALFDRAEARDFADVYALSKRYPKELLLTLAADFDRGFDKAIFSQMIGSLDRFPDDAIPVATDDVATVRAFFADWAAELR
ncbi:MAG TPA: nucleotidyl transferase AbiEii/AbiGii toxin family protein [Amycolatopsis sp.]|uniref:Nucleotidyl transferase AbiEii/AbiGii toxin family protein n=1 Tax=Amycolatopsis nalaikhensis TaxID=715472 RepID=A0ABY8XNR5_9PSEU|nr:nucleotidyl transferase AbiEii/AbiGii toxin family protein [Amycolatopsis sp. 2-2]WIV57283.1 nucleotidyl transferase AbiEii/AbiGii toxin family protein [Amycolatopsis sp. 2-2]